MGDQGPADGHDHDHGHDHAHDHGDGHDDAAVSFDERAATWDDEAKIARARTIADRIGEEVALSGTERLFEYGAGTGLVAEALRDRVGAITLVDPSEGMRAVAQSKVDDGRLPGARIWDLDLAARGAPEGETFELIVTSMVLHHVAELGPTLEAFVHMLAPGGHCCVIDLDAEDGSFHGPDVDVHHGFHREDMAAQLTAAGFTEVSVTDCGTVDHGDDEFSLFLAVATR